MTSEPAFIPTTDIAAHYADNAAACTLCLGTGQALTAVTCWTCDGTGSIDGQRCGLCEGRRAVYRHALGFNGHGEPNCPAARAAAEQHTREQAETPHHSAPAPAAQPATLGSRAYRQLPKFGTPEYFAWADEFNAAAKAEQERHQR